MKRFNGFNTFDATPMRTKLPKLAKEVASRSKMSISLLVLALTSGCASTQNENKGEIILDQTSNQHNFTQDSHHHIPTESLTNLLEAEFLLQRDGPGAAYSKFIKILRQEKSTTMAKRVTNIAIASQNPAYIEESTNLWIDIDPKAEDPYPLQLQIYFASGRFKPATELIEQALAYGIPLQFLPSYLDQHSREVDTLETVQQTLMSLSSSAASNIYIQLANNRLDFFSGQYERVQTTIQDKLLNTAPKSECRSLYILLGYSQEQLGKTNEAITTLQTGLKDFPNSKHLLIPLVELLVSNNQEGEALTIYREADLSSFDGTQLGLTLAGKLIEHNRFDEALGILTSLPKKQYGLQDQTKLLTAEALNKLGRSHEAFEILQTVDGPLAWNATQRMIQILYKLGKENEVNVVAFERLNIEKIPEEAISIASLHERYERSDLSLDFLNKVLKTYPKADAVRYKKAILLESMNRWEDAVTELKTLSDNAPANPQYLNALGYTILVNSEQLDLAQEYIEKAYNIDNTDPAIIDSLGWVLFLRNDFEQATFYLQKAWELLKDAEIGAHYGETLWRQGHQSLANDIWRQAYEINPNYPVLMETLERLNPALKTELTK